MKPLWRGVLIGVVAYLVFLIATVPADRVLSLLQPRLQGLRLAGVEGTLWSGSAVFVNAAPVQIDDVHWGLRPFALFMGRAEFAVEGQLRGQTVRANAGSSFLGRPYLRDVSGRVLANELPRWMGIKLLEVTGDVDVDLDEVVWPESGLPAIDGSVVWSSATVVGPVELELGKVNLNTQIEDGVTRGKLATQDGALLVTADVELNPGGAYRLDADIQQKGDVPDAVAKFLSSFAEYKDGSYRLEWSDSL